MKNLYILCFLLSLFASCGSSKEGEVQAGLSPVNGKEIPLGGNSYITSAAANGTVNDEGFSAWSTPETVFSTWFRVNRAGDINLFLTYTSESDKNVIEVSCKGKKFEVELPQTAQTEETIYLGTVTCEAGYVQVDFKGVKRAGSVYCKPSALVVDGPASADMNYVDDFSYYWGRRGPSVHMSYEIPTGVTAEWFYNEVTVPEGEDPVGSYFMANGFGEGYFGIQVNSSSERRVLFSVWSPYETDDPSQIPDEHKIILVKKGEGVYTGEFGNEGSGGQSYLRYNWQAGVTYRFLTRVRPAENGYSEYTSYFYAPEAGNWMLIAQFLRPGTNTYYTRPYSFLENFDNTKGYLGRKAHYNNQWIFTTEGKWMELTKGKFTVDATAQAGARMDYKGGSDSNGFFLQNCGFLNDYTSMGTLFERAPGNKEPDVEWGDLK